jgi:hypothetical protein
MHPTCTVCRGTPTGGATCTGHPALDRCVLCGRPRPERGAAGWLPFTGTSVRCPTCATGSVDTQEQARRHIRLVRSQLDGLGIRLDQRVRITLADPDELNEVDHGSARLGRTARRTWHGGRSEVLGIDVARGLTVWHFGAVTAHEIGHAWLTQHGATGLRPMLEEGTCELFSAAWLKKQPSPLAAALRRAIADNPDPVYGNGYRAVRSAVVRHGVAAVLTSLSRHRRLP